MVTKKKMQPKKQTSKLTIAIVAFAVVATLLLISAFAGTGNISFEPNNSALNVTDSTAYNGSFISFEGNEPTTPVNLNNLTPRQLPNGKTVNLAEGFEINEYASGLNSPRHMAFSAGGTLFTGSKKDNASVVALIDTDNNGSSDKTVVIDEGLNVPHSLHVNDGDLYVATETQVIRYNDITDNGTFSSRQVLVSDIPRGAELGGGGHRTRTVAIGPDDKMYVSIGSSCNVCEESNPKRATMMQFNKDGSGGRIYATGLRNTIDYEFYDGKIWAVDTGRDNIGDNQPPEELNIIKDGGNYGWPKCHGNGQVSPEYRNAGDYCQNMTEKPFLNMQAHSTATGISFLNSAAKGSWPSQLDSAAFMVFRGSWNRVVPTGYKVVWADVKSGQPQTKDFLTGWLVGGSSWGRPVGVEFSPSGDMFVSDDTDGRIYKISRK